MSIVGTRPPLISETNLYEPRHKEVFDSKILAYITSDRPNMSAQIAPDVIDYFIDHLDKIGPYVLFHKLS